MTFAGACASRSARACFVALLAIGFGVGCSDDDKADDDVIADDATDDEPTDPCASSPPLREEPTPPAYTWSFESEEVGGTTLRYYPTPLADGLVVLFDGGGDSNAWFIQVEARYQVEALVDAGYAVMALTSAYPNGTPGDYDPEPDPELNVDMQNLTEALGLMESIGVPVSPLFFLGFSGGGHFGSFAARHVSVNAIGIFNARGASDTYQPDATPEPPPTVWVLGAWDADLVPEDSTIQANRDVLTLLGLDSEILTNEPRRAGSGAFTRIASPDAAVTLEDSSALVAQLIDDGFLDECGAPVQAAGVPQADDVTLGPSFQGHRDFPEEARRQFQELSARHAITSDFKAEIVAFFDAHR